MWKNEWKNSKNRFCTGSDERKKAKNFVWTLKKGKYAVLGAALIIFFAVSPLLGAAQDWPYDHDPMAVDSLDDMLNPSDDNIIYAPGGPV